MAAVSLTAVAPLGASTGVVVQITGTGFDPVASNNTVTLTAPGGTSASLVGETIAVLDAVKGLRRLAVTMPAGLPIGSAAIVVTNTITKETAGGRTLQIVQIALPQTASGARGVAQLPVRVAGSPNVQFVAGRTTVSFGAGVTVKSVQLESATSLIATIAIAANAALGPRTVTAVTSTQTAMTAGAFTVLDPNRAPAFTSTPPLGAIENEPYAYQAAATDPDGDEVSFRLLSGPAGLTVSTSGQVAWTPGTLQVGSHDVALEAADGRGGAAQQTFRIGVAAAPRLESIEVAPGLLRFAATNQVRHVSVTGRRSDGQTVDLTAAGTGTTYESTNRFVAAVAPDGGITAVGNGDAVITARNGSLTDSVPVVVETGVTLESLQLNPPLTTLRNGGETQRLMLIGRFSDGTSRDLTTAAGTTYVSGDESSARVAADGLVTAVASGQVTITAAHDTLETTASVIVSISAGAGFLRGEVYDDSRGLPLPGATVTLVSDGGGTPSALTQTTADGGGQFSIRGRAGDAVVRISKPGFTAVERRGQIPADAAATLLDARLTPFDTRASPIGSATGGTARDERQRATLQISPGGLPVDSALTLTLVSPQGLEGRLPAGWSPIAAISIEPANLTFSFPVTLTLPHLLPTTPSDSTLTLARYDQERHEWVTVAGQPQAGPGGSTVVASIDRSGQFAVLVPDGPPSAPPVVVADDPLRGIDLPVDVPSGMTAVGEVIPRSAPPGESARALGRVGLIAPGPIVSGTIVQVRVSERFDLLDSSQLHTLPFTQDLVAYALPRQQIGGSVGASFPVTPSRDFTIQQLMLGAIRLDVHGFVPDAAATSVGPGGGTIGNAEGDALIVPAGALQGDAPIVVRRVDLAGAGITLPAGLALIAAVQVEAPGTTFGDGTQLSTAAAGLSATDRVLVTRVFTDPLGQRRLRLVALGEVAAGRLVTQIALGGVSLEGIRAGGEFVFLRAEQPVGFVAGTVLRASGAAVAAAVVTTDSLAIADLSSLSGAYLVPVVVGAPVTVRANDAASGDSGTASRQLDTAGQVVPTTLTLAVVGPSVLSVIPAGGSTNVALDTPITIDFSEPIGAESVSETSVVLQLAGTAVSVQRALSADRKRLVVRPSAALAPNSSYALSLTSGLRDVSGNALSAFVPVSFTTFDPSKPAQPVAGQLTAELPDESGLVLVTGAPGFAAPAGAVTVTNTRTQETTTTLARTDGSFRVHIGAQIADELVVTLRGTDGRDISVRIAQFTGADGSTSIGAAGGTIAGPDGRSGSILPRALARAGVFKLEGMASTEFPVLPAGFSYADTFALRIGGAAFRSLASVTLSESQNRFAPSSAFADPFEVTGDLTVPTDALTSSTIRLAVAVQDDEGSRRSAAATTMVVATEPDRGLVETSHGADFPTVFLTAPRETLAGQQVTVRAIAPTARVDLTRPVPSGVLATDSVLLVRREEAAGATRLFLIDKLDVVSAGATPLLRTMGRELPGMTAPGDYAMVATHDAFVWATGVATGADAIVTVDGLPFAFHTRGPNGRFAIPVRANEPFTLRFVDSTGSARGSSAGSAPQTGSIDVGSPLASATQRLTVETEPDERSLVDINTPLVLRFSEPIDGRSVATALIVTDDAGLRVFGRTVVSDDGLTATFRPLRRWRFATTYRFGLGMSLLARSGARLPATFSGQFRTFAARIVGTLAVGEARDVAVSGSTALVGTATGFSSVNASSPRNLELLASVPVAGGAGGVSLLSGSTITDRNGAVHGGPLALIAAGSESTAGTVQTFDVTNPTTPLLLGSTQVTTATGQSAPTGVPPVSGTPRTVVTDGDGRAYVAVESAGVALLNLGAAIPLDVATPARGAEARYPEAAESISDVALLENRLVVAGAAGLTVLDAATLARLGRTATTGAAQGAAVLNDFPMDVDGSGIIAQDTEVLDVAVVANGSDGTLQIYRLPEIGDPFLLSVIRFTGETSGVRVDAQERLAYVALGDRGIAFVDLDGPASVQPIDDDRNGVDDRILGAVDTPGSARRVALDLSRGVGYVADGPGGVAVLQVVPPRTRFLTLRRDPLRGAAGDEESILQSGTAFTTDDAIQVSLEAPATLDEQLTLVLQQNGPSSAVAFEDGSAATRLLAGHNARTLLIARGAPQLAATLIVQNQAGAVVATQPFRLTSPDPGTAGLTRLFVAPSPAILPLGTPSLQLSVGGRFTDDRVRNLTLASSGTKYEIVDSVIASIGADGLISAAAGGRTDLAISNGDTDTVAAVDVRHDPVLVAFEANHPFLTLTSGAAPVALDIAARFSDRSTRTASAVPGTTFASSDAGVVAVSETGLITAVANGSATITAVNGSVRAEIQTTVELAAQVDLTGITLRPIGSITTDDGAADVEAVVTGTGSVESLVVRFSVSIGAVEARDAQVLRDGQAGTRLSGFASAGTFTVTASVVDPADGQVLTSTQSIEVRRGTGDHEPNATADTAPDLTQDTTVHGSVGGSGDSNDVYRIATDAAGALTLNLLLSSSTIPAGLTVVVRDASGAEVGRFAVSSTNVRLAATMAPGGGSIEILSSGGPVSYALSFKFRQAPQSITTVNPSSGPPGTIVTIVGTGFTSTPGDTHVLFGGISGRVISASPTQIVAQVPADGVNGPIDVVSGSGTVRGPAFVTGTATLPEAFLLPEDPAMTRYDPVSATFVDITRLVIEVDPLVTRSNVDTLAAALGGTVVGTSPLTHGYVLAFPSNRTFAGLENLRRQLAGSAGVLGAETAEERPLNSNRIDSRDNSGTWPGEALQRGAAFEQVRLHEALDAIRRTPPFTDANKLRKVRVVVIDSGFKPFLTDEFNFSGMKYLQRNAAGVFVESPFRDRDNHGTKIAGIVGALNNGSAFSGALTGVYRRGENPNVDLIVYGCPGTVPGEMNSQCTNGALHHLAGVIRNEGGAVPTVVNLSSGLSYADRPAVYASQARYWRQMLAAFRPAQTVFVAAAGNDGVQAAKHLPSAEFDRRVNGISVGGSSLFSDTRANYTGGKRRVVRGDVACQTQTAGSNCGPGITLAAPGEGVFTTSTTAPGYNTVGESFGTSLAAPIVAATAALLQVIRPTDAPLDAQRVKEILNETKDSIIGVWQPGVMFRLNALAAVRTVLPAATSQKVFITDSRAAVVGGLVGIEIDPTTGRRPANAPPDHIVPVTQPGDSPAGLPSTAVVAARTDRIYVVAVGLGNSGDGIAVINTHSLLPEEFIPLSGADPATGVSQPQGVDLKPLRPGLALSKDERLLYVAGGDRIFIINTVTGSLVKDYDELPAQYRAVLPALQPLESLNARLNQISIEIGRGELNDLTVSADGRTLYAVISSYNGIAERAAILPINIDLYKDGSPSAGVQSDLTAFLVPGPRRLVETSGRPAEVEPSDIVANPATGHVYVSDGGWREYIGNPGFFDSYSRYTPLLNAQLTGAGSGTAGSLEFEQSADLLDDRARDGFTLLDAPGFFTSFAPDATPGRLGSLNGQFPSEIVFGWKPPAADGGRVVNQFNFREIYAKRPAAIAMHPKGDRALVAFGQTANFGVLDVTAQALFPSATPATNGLFTGLAAVTESIPLDPHLWPRRGVVTLANGGRMPSRDEALLFPSAIKYAQNGRFAVAVHRGIRPPGPASIRMPNFSTNTANSQELQTNGFVIAPGASSGLDPDGVTVTENTDYVGDRGGGAITIIDDLAVADDLTNAAQPTVGGRLWFSLRPVCRTAANLPKRGCVEQPFERLFDYNATGTPLQFDRPIDVAIQPFVAIETPYFGDEVFLKTAVLVRWRDTRGTEVKVTVTDLTGGGTEAPVPVPASADGPFATIAFGSLFQGAPTPGRLYRIEATLFKADGEPISSTSIDVKF